MHTDHRSVLALVTAVLVLQCWCVVHAGPEPSPINHSSGKWWPEWDSEEDTSLAADEVNVSTAQGHTASLPCRVMHLQDKTVSWIRASDLTVLAVDRTIVTSDARFSVKHPEETGDWILDIRSASSRDSGTYDCQINTHPKISTRVHLKVLSQKDANVFLEIPASDSIAHQKQTEASPTPYVQSSLTSPSGSPTSSKHAVSLRILGRSWAEVMAGKVLGLTCEATGHDMQEVHASSRAQDSPLIEWTLDDVPVKMLFNKEKVEIYEDWQPEKVLSQLTLFDLAVEDSGSFACHAPHALTRVIPVTVLHKGYQNAGNSLQDMKHQSKIQFEESKFSYMESRRQQHQMDAAGSSTPTLHGELAHSRAASCSSHQTIMISGVVMLVIMLINCALCLTMYYKSH